MPTRRYVRFDYRCTRSQDDSNPLWLEAGVVTRVRLKAGDGTVPLGL